MLIPEKQSALSEKVLRQLKPVLIQKRSAFDFVQTARFKNYGYRLQNSNKKRTSAFE